MRKIGCVLLVIAVLCSCLAACKNTGGSTPNTSEGSTGGQNDKKLDKWGREMIYSPLDETLSYNNDEITFLVRDADVCKGQFEESIANRDIVNTEVFSRNEMVQNRLNVSLKFLYTEQGVGNSEYNAKITQDAMASHEYDVASTFAYYSSAMLYQGYYYNLLNLNNLYLDQPYWNQSYCEEASLYGQLYMVIGDVSLLAIQNTFCIFFNKTEFNRWQTGVDLYEAVRNKEWTSEYFYEIVKSIYQDTNGNSRYDVNDYYGLVSTAHSFNSDAFFAAAGLKICTKDEDGIPQLTLNSDRTLSVYEQTFQLLHETRGVCFTASDAEGLDAARNAFITGRSVFSVDMLKTGGDYSDEGVTMGVLPLYMFDSTQQNYATTVQDSYDALAILNVGEARAEMVAAVLEMMSYYSYLTVRPTYFESVTKLLYSDISDDAEMYDLILDTVYFDYGMINSYAISRPNLGHLWRTLLENENSNFTTAYGANSKIYSDGLATYLAYFLEISEE